MVVDNDIGAPERRIPGSAKRPSETLKCTSLMAAAASLALAASTALGAETEIPLKNARFDDGTAANGLPIGWSLYGGRGHDQRISITDDGCGGKALLIEDGDPDAEIGLTQLVPIQPNLGYEVRVRARAAKNASDHGANVQLRFLPSNTIAQTPLQTHGPDEFHEVAVRGVAPPDTKAAQIYLYTHRAPTPRILVGGVRLISGVKPPPPLPPPVPPQYAKLKDLHLTTQLVRDGRPLVRIVTPASGAYAAQATRLQSAIERLTGCRVPIAADDSPDAAAPIKSSLIVIGNRSTNATIAELYNRFFLLTDLRYPGPEGFEVRTIHNPFGDGHNVILLGASDTKGIDAAVETFGAKLAAAKNGSLAIGWLMDVRLGRGLAIPRDLQDMEIWEASSGYRSTGYFGWNSISKRMAAYYMSGDPSHARDALRLAFPDKQAFQEITRTDGEMIENKDDPLAGPYHYNAHMMILFWDLIEESPVFSDAERLKVTNAFARQLEHRKNEGVYSLRQPAPAVGSRHGQWSAVSLYCLGRYFQRDYPDPIWDQCVLGAQNAFAPLRAHAWINGESDNLFWYCTGIAPVFTYMLLSGERGPMQNGVAATLLRAQEVLISGRAPDWALQSAALDYLHKVAYLTQDGRWLTYRDHTGIDLRPFRLGQSFWPPEGLRPKLPDDLDGKWTVSALPKAHWSARANGLPLDESFYNASFRDAPDASGDFILLDGFNGASRNPYHTFAILELRLAGHTILQGYRNQVLTKADGMVEPMVAMDAALRHRDVIGQTALCIGEVPKAAFCNWRRTLAQRIGRYALIVDDLTFRTDTENMEIQIKWENSQRPFHFDVDRNALVLRDAAILSADAFDRTPVADGIATQEWNRPARKGQHATYFALLAAGTNSPTNMRCLRLQDNAAALALPQPAVAFAGTWEGGTGDLVVLAEDHLSGHRMTRATQDPPLLMSDTPIDADWDFATGRMEITTRGTTSVTAAIADPATVRGANFAPGAKPSATGNTLLLLPEGHAVIEGIRPPDAARRDLSTKLGACLDRATASRTSPRQPAAPARAPAPGIATAFSAQVGGAVTDLIVLAPRGRQLFAAAKGSTIHLIDTGGQTIRQMQTDGNIRQLHWWPENDLLLAGCEDEKVCAFDLAGNRKWTFVSEMDPAVFRAAKQYWFKSAPGHGGIHGLGTGVFLDGKSQAFVGSACTLEIVDGTGRLLKRLPQFWGTVYKFAIAPGPNGSLNLLASRRITDGPSLGIINNRTLDPTPRGFDSVPAGHTRVPGWMDQTRHHIFVEDLDGDGQNEVVSEITGAWNRLTVWDLQGQPLHNVQFGPGARGFAREIRDIDIGDMDADRKKEIGLALSSGLLVTFDHRCERLWSVRLPTAPVLLKIIGRFLVAGCEDGTVSTYDAHGHLAGVTSIPGRPTCAAAPGTNSSVVIATDRGEIRALRIGN